MAITITKSKFIAGCQCLKRLYLLLNSPELGRGKTAADFALLAQGREVGLIAHRLFPGGVTVTSGDPAEAIRITQELIANPEVPAIFEGAFVSENLLVRVDILQRQRNNKWRIVEVKSSADLKEDHYHLEDVAVQCRVVSHCGLQVGSCWLAHVNRKYVFEGGKIEAKKFFKLRNLTRRVQELQSKLIFQLRSEFRVLAMPNPPNLPVGRHCTNPVACEFYDVCNKPRTDDYIGHLPYSDPFTIRDGRYIGHDGFVVPKDFDEFHERFPEYVRKWVKRHAEATASREDVEDLTHDLLIHLRYLPLNSKHREAGKEDVIQTFDPMKHFGANQARFQNYLNLCLANKFRTLRSKRMKDALSHIGNVSLDTQRESGDPFSISDEFCHWHSEHLQRATNASEKRHQDRTFLREFVDFIRREDPNVLPAVEALFLAQTQGAAARSLGITEAQFNRSHNRLLQLGRCFLSGEPTPRQRKPYKKRKKTLNLAAIPKKIETPPTPSAASNLGVAFAKEWEGLARFVPVPLLSNPSPLR